MGPLYLDTSVVLRACLEGGTSPELEEKLLAAPILVTSHLSLVEAARAFLRLRHSGERSEIQLAAAMQQVEAIWSRCEIWELTRAVCEMAAQVAPAKNLRTLDALHLATFLSARRRIEGLDLLTAEDRLQAAAR